MLVRKLYSPLFLAIYLYLLIQLSVFNLFSGLLDEGFLLYNASLITQGHIPYRDFFMTTTPGSTYVIAFFFKIFGEYMIIGRILGICSGLITLLLCNKLFQFDKYWQYLYLCCLTLFLVAPARAFFYNDAIVFLLGSFYFLVRSLEKKNFTSIYISGLLSGFCFIFKQSIGGLLIPAIIVAIVFTQKRNAIKRSLIFYITGIFTILVPFAIYFARHHALHDMFYYIFFFAQTVKNHQSSFLLHRLIAIPVFILCFIIFKFLTFYKKIFFLIILCIVFGFYILLDINRIGRLFTYLTDQTFYANSIIFLFPLIALSFSLIKNTFHNKKITITAIIYLVLFLSIAASGYSMAPVGAVAPLAIPLIIYCYQTYIKKKTNKSQITALLITILIIGYTYLFSYNLLLSEKRVFGAYPMHQYTTSLTIEKAYYILFTKKEAYDLKQMISYIEKTTTSEEKIFCFPYCPGLLFLSNRQGGSYFNLFYFETFMEKDQNIVIKELENNNVSLVVLQKTGGLEQRTELEKDRLSSIYNYIYSHFTIDYETPNFIVLKR